MKTKKSETIVVRLSTKTKRELEEISEKKDIPISQIVRKMIENNIEMSTTIR